eukprot:4582526-Alexandrium_andersonii.AAC.1
MHSAGWLGRAPGSCGKPQSTVQQESNIMTGTPEPRDQEARPTVAEWAHPPKSSTFNRGPRIRNKEPRMHDDEQGRKYMEPRVDNKNRAGMLTRRGTILGTRARNEEPAWGSNCQR